MIRSLVAITALLLACCVPVFAKTSTATAASSDSTVMPRCSLSDPVVWINTKSNVYHVKGDRYFGNTKSGRYACTSKAIGLGAHGLKSGTGMKSTQTDSEAATPAPTRKGKHKKQMDTPDDGATP